MMKRKNWLTISVLTAATLVGTAAAQSAGKGKGRARGKNAGEYALSVTGYYKGTGTATMGDKLALSATVKTAGGATGDLAVKDLVVTRGYFKGEGTVMGIACTVQGRVDLPNAQDEQQTDRQAVTGRITGTFKDANGKVGRLVAVQQDSASNGNENETENEKDDDQGKGKDKR